jgi:hypothetical protein
MTYDLWSDQAPFGTMHDNSHGYYNVETSINPDLNEIVVSSALRYAYSPMVYREAGVRSQRAVTMMGVNSSMFLTREELLELTDYRQSAAQRRWLIQRGWRFEIGRDGHPKVLRNEVEGRMQSKPARARAGALSLGKVA